jgi:hypothetical protein
MAQWTPGILMIGKKLPRLSKKKSSGAVTAVGCSVFRPIENHCTVFEILGNEFTCCKCIIGMDSPRITIPAI